MRHDGERAGTERLVIVVLLVIVASLVVLSVNASQRTRADFDDEVREATDLVRGQLQERILGGRLKAEALRGLFAASEEVSASEFRSFSTLLLESGALTGVTALGWSPRIERADVPAFEAARRADSDLGRGAMEDFTVHPPVTAADADIVSYVEPFGPNRAVLGFDLASNPARRAAIDRARDTGEVISTEPIVLVHDEDDGAAVILYAAVYAGGAIPNDVTERRRLFVGAVSVVLRSADFLAEVVSDPRIDVTVLDVETADALGGEDPMARLLPARAPGVATSLAGDGVEMRMLDAPGRTWELFAAPSTSPPPRVDPGALIPRLLPVLAVVALFWLVGRSERRALRASREALLELAASEARSAALVRKSPDAVLLLDADGEVRFASDEALRLLGAVRDGLFDTEPLSAVQAIDRAVADGMNIRAVLPTLAEGDVRTVLDRLLAEGRVDAEGRTVDGRAVDVAAVRIEDGQVLLSIRDATSRVETFTALERAVEREHQAAVAGNELAASRRALLSTVSHELRTPLAAILGFAWMLRQSLDDDTMPHPAMLGQAVDAILRNTATLDTIVDDLVAFSRLERDDFTVEQRRVLLRSLVSHTTDALAPVLDWRRIEIGGVEVTATGDEAALGRVVTNLVVNAVRYSPAAAPIGITTCERDGRAVLVVEDGGPGIPPEERERVFEQYVRGRAAVDSGTVGTGIGLAVVRGLVWGMSGDVVLDESPLGGARFTIDLPLHDPTTGDEGWDGTADEEHAGATPALIGATMAPGGRPAAAAPTTAHGGGR